MSDQLPALRSWSDDCYDYREVVVGRSIGREEARQLLTQDAEYGRWELARTVVYYGGLRTVRLRRRTMRVALTKLPLR